MKSLRYSIPILSLLFASCSSPSNTTVNNPTAPIITGFSPDTVWTLQDLTVYGAHFGYDPADLSVAIGGVPLESYFENVDDTILTFYVADSAQTGLLRVATINGSATSTKPVTVEHTFNPHSINDSIPVGTYFSIPGTGMKNYRKFIVLRVGSLPLPIDSILDCRIVSHVVAGCYSGSVTISDSSGTHYCGNLAVTRPSTWKTLSEIWDNIVRRETHYRAGFINGPAVRVDSSWIDTVVYSGQHDLPISGTPLVNAGEILDFDLRTPLLQLSWDTVRQTAWLSFQLAQSVSPPSPTLRLDTSWSNFGTVEEPALLPVDRDIEFTFPNNFGYQITEDSVDGAGLVDWQESTTTTMLSGSFDLILKQ